MTQLKKNKPRLKDIAKAANVSIPAASMALADHPQISAKTKRHIRFLSRKLGYQRPGDRYATQKRKAQSQQSARIGFMLLGDRLEEDVHAFTLHELTLQTQAAGVRLEVAAVESTDPRQAIAPISEFAKHVDALILSGYVDPTLLQHVKSLNIACVVLGHIMVDSNTPLVHHECAISSHNQVEMGRLATTHLASCGHQRIAFVCEVLPPGLAHSRWLAGYWIAHHERQLPLDAQLVQVAGKAHAGAQSAAKALMALDQPPTAFVVPDVRIGASLINALNEQGLQLGPASIVLGGLQSVAKHYHLQDYPLLENDTNRMAKVAIDYLLRLHEQPSSDAIELIVPFRVHNFPDSSICSES